MSSKYIATERTTYAPIIDYIRELGFSAVQEIRVGNDFMDVCIEYGRHQFVLEVKKNKERGKSASKEKLIKGISQAYGYAQRKRINNFIVVVYPWNLSNPKNINVIAECSVDLTTDFIVLTPWWAQDDNLNIRTIFTTLRNKIEGKETAPDRLNFLIRHLNLNIKLFSEVLRRYYFERLDELTDKALGNIIEKKGKEKKKKGRDKKKYDLLSCIFVDQLLFYHIFHKMTINSSSHISPLPDKINSIDDVKTCFEEIKGIDYEPIFGINIIEHIEDVGGILIDKIQDIILNIKALEPEKVRHDLLGRLFHELIPADVRKIISAYYTSIPSSDLLSRLCIDTFDKSVYDPACGSGTLLVSAYNIKNELFVDMGRPNESESSKIHKQFLEKDITGTDIMPFACHLAAINLSSQNLRVKTDLIRISRNNSLSLSPLFITGKPFLQSASTEYLSGEVDKLRPIQHSLHSFIEPRKIPKTKSHEKPSTFSTTQVDIVLMNPPFADKNKLPEEYWKSMGECESLVKKCGRDVNTWGYFLALADDMIVNGGKIGAIIPVDFLRGTDSKKIRDFIFENYYTKYIIRPPRNCSFSEGCEFMDIILVVEKRKPKQDDKTMIIMLKEDPRNTQKFTLMNVRGIKEEISQAIALEVEGKHEYFDHFVVDYEQLISTNNHQSLVAFSNLENKKKVCRFFDELKEKSGDKLMKFKKNDMLDGFHASPKGVSELLFITNPLYESRLKNAHLILEKEDPDNAYFKVEKNDTIYPIKKDYLKKAIRTITGIKNFWVRNKHDYFILEECDDFKSILISSKYRGKPLDWNEINKRVKRRESHLSIPHNLRLNSKDTFVTALYCDEKMITHHGFNVFPGVNMNDAKILSLYMNSIVYLIQILLIRGQTRPDYIQFSKSDLLGLDFLDVTKLNDEEKSELIKLSDELKDIEFNCLIHQIKNKEEYRLKIDKAILKVLGFTDSKINNTINNLYDVFVEEIE